MMLSCHRLVPETAADLCQQDLGPAILQQLASILAAHHETVRVGVVLLPDLTCNDSPSGMSCAGSLALAILLASAGCWPDNLSSWCRGHSTAMPGFQLDHEQDS